jgi:DNA-binding HxlR family transcriptional regulator
VAKAARHGTAARRRAAREGPGRTHRDPQTRFANREALQLDRVIHERMRLGIVSALAANESLGFNDLKELLQTTDGNLSVHARKLEEAQYVSCTKYFEGRVPRTRYRLTPAGRRALEAYLNHMEALIQATRRRQG